MMSPQWTRRHLLQLGSVIGIGSVAGCIGLSDTDTTTRTPDDAGSSTANVDRAGYRGDTFTGVVTVHEGSDVPADVAAGTYEGTIVYDRSCYPVGDGRTECDAGIALQSFGTVNFSYEHDMEQTPCLVPYQEVVLSVNEAGAIVRRKR